MSKKELDAKLNEELSSAEETSASSDLQNSNVNDIYKKKYDYVYKKKSVRNRARRRTVSLIMLVFILVASLIAGVVYGVLEFIDFNSFRITIDRNYAGYLTLADNYEFENASSVLSTEGLKYMTNTTYSWINIQKLLNQTGSLSERDYIATSFYLKNQGEEGVFYSENVILTNSYKKLEDTIRILLIKQVEYEDEDGNLYWSEPEYKCFAKVASDGVSDEYVAGGDEVIPNYALNPNNPESNEPWKCTSFYDTDNGRVLDKTYYPIMPGQRVRYAMAIWIEGTDPETTDEKLGGRVSYTFEFSLMYDNNDVVFVPDEA